MAVAEELPTEPTARVAELADLSPARAALTLAWPGILEQLVRASGQAVVFALGGALRGAGDTRYTLRITAFNWIVMRLPLSVLLGAVLGLGLAGVWLAMVADYFVRAGLMALRFRSGQWQRLRY